MGYKIAHFDDGTKDVFSHCCYFKNLGNLPALNIEDYSGYGESKKEAFEDLKNNLKTFFKACKEMEMSLYSSDNLYKSTVEVDCFGNSKD